MNGGLAARNPPGYRVSDDASLRERTTFRVAARAARLIEVDDADATAALFGSGTLGGAEVLVLGGGSNMLFTRDWPGIVLAPTLRGIRLIEDRGDAAVLRCAAGEVWNDVVIWSLEHALVGLENLVSIPGKVGAGPIQNIGAYGTELREFVHAVDAFDRQTGRSVRFANADCAFGYRDSRFKRHPGRYVILAVEFLLPRRRELRIGYSGVPEELASMGIEQPDARAVARAIARIRQRKLPDPAITGNAGSFFKNPTVAAARAEAMRGDHPTMPIWPADDGQAKLSAAWLIETCGFKGRREGDAGVSPHHALVLINYGEASGAQIWSLAQRIQEAVAARFDVRLEPEVQVI